MVGEVEWHGAFGEVDNIAARGVDKDFIGKEVEFELFAVDFFASSKLGGRFLEFANPE